MKNKLTYFITRSTTFGLASFLMFKYTTKDSWIPIVLGTMLGVIVLYIYKYIKDYFKDKNVRDTLSKTFIGKVYLFIFLIFYVYIMIMILILLPMFVNSFYLLYTPKILVVLPFLAISVYITFKSKKTLEALSNLLLPFSFLIIIFYMLFLTKYIEFGNLMPILSTKTINIMKSTLIFTSITSIPYIITINFNNNGFKNDVKDYLIASLTSLGIILFTILSLGDPLIQIYSFPEYAALKQIKVLKFIENIENLSSFVWYFDMFISLAALTRSVKETVPKKYNIIYFIICLIIVTYISVFIIGANYRLMLGYFYTYPIILFIFFCIFVTLLLYIKFSKKLNQ